MLAGRVRHYRYVLTNGLSGGDSYSPAEVFVVRLTKATFCLFWRKQELQDKDRRYTIARHHRRETCVVSLRSALQQPYLSRLHP